VSDAGRRWRRGLGATVLATLAGCASSAIATAPVLTLESAAVDDAATLRVAGRACDTRPPVRLELVETRETYPVRFVIEVRPGSAPEAGCVPFQAALSLATLPAFAEACRERCLIEVRTPGGQGRTLVYPQAER
jgi:hypothetical protein